MSNRPLHAAHKAILGLVPALTAVAEELEQCLRVEAAAPCYDIADLRPVRVGKRSVRISWNYPIEGIPAQDRPEFTCAVRPADEGFEAFEQRELERPYVSTNGHCQGDIEGLKPGTEYVVEITAQDDGTPVTAERVNVRTLEELTDCTVPAEARKPSIPLKHPPRDRTTITIGDVFRLREDRTDLTPEYIEHLKGMALPESLVRELGLSPDD